MRARQLLQLLVCAATLSCSSVGIPERNPLSSSHDSSNPVFEDVSAVAGFRAVGSNTGAAWVDFDNDGFEDLFVGHHTGPSVMHRNDGRGVFVEVEVGTEFAYDQHGFTWGDYDNDGWSDLYVTAGRGTRGSLFLINQDGNFRESAGQAQVSNHWGRGRLARWADYDNDGCLDLFVGNADSRKHHTEDDRLYRNNSGDGTFTDVTEDCGLVGDHAETAGLAWGDYDNDGFVDLLLGGFLRLRRNNGDGTFSDVTTRAGIRPVFTRGTAWGDYDNDGDLDFFVARGRTGFGDWLRLENDNRICFAGNAEQDADGFSFSHSGSRLTVSVSFADYPTRSGYVFIGASGRHPAQSVSFSLDQNDARNLGRPASVRDEEAGLFIWRTRRGWQVHWIGNRFMGTVESNGAISQPTPIDLEPYDSSSQRKNFLYANNGDGTFTDVTRRSGLYSYPPAHSRSAAWIDFDNDTDLDLYEVNLGGVDIGPQLNRLYRNNGDGTFTDVAGDVGLQAPEGYSACGAWGDYDQDGFLDVFVVAHWWTSFLGGPEKLFRNGGNGNHWLRVRLVGIQSNRQGVGARVEVRTVSAAGPIRQYRDTSLSSGSECQNSSIVHFGLGREDQVEHLQIHWPSGIVDVFQDLAADQVLTIQEGSGSS